jgi:hypothetical protein
MPDINAGQEPVKKPEEGVELQPTAPEATLDSDPEIVISSLLDENKKLAAERENYRKGMLKAKGKLTEDDEPEDLETIIDRKVNEKLLNSQWIESQRRLEETAKKLARENKELKLAAINKAPKTSQGAGSGAAAQPADATLSAEKLAHLKNVLKWDEAKIEKFKKNLSMVSVPKI